MANPAADGGYSRLCFVCSSTPTMACARCRLDYYCGKGCQRSDWKRHRLFCRYAGEPNAAVEPSARYGCFDVNDLTIVGGPETNQQPKAEILARVKDGGVRQLFPVFCDTDRAWVRELLEAAAPLLEELDLWNSLPEHWLVLPTMKRLLRLEVNSWFQNFEGSYRHPPTPLPPLPPAPEPTRLLWLRVCLPEEPLLSILKSHAATLRELQLFVGTNGQPARAGSRDFPWSCGAAQLAKLLKECHLHSLRRLVLRRPHAPTFSLSGQFTHHAALCRRQLQVVKEALPSSISEVLCGTCDKVTWKCFEQTVFGLF